LRRIKISVAPFSRQKSDGVQWGQGGLAYSLGTWGHHPHLHHGGARAIGKQPVETAAMAPRGSWHMGHHLHHKDVGARQVAC